MKAIGFYILLPFIYLLSLLPFWILYPLSDLMYLALYYLIGYRKKVVLQNLRNSFPQKTNEEITQISKKFFRYLCDLTLETLKTLSISRKEILKRVRFTPESLILLQRLYEEKKSSILVLGHYGNWEWAGASFSLRNKNQLFVIYRPLSNKHFDNLLYNMRTRFGTKLIAFKNVLRDMIKNRDLVSVTAFIADQTPHPEGAFWMAFLNQDTPVFMGTEKIARKLNYPILYTHIKRIRRGYYELGIEMMFENPQSTKEGEITMAHTRRLEEDILKYPEIWLWSHKRWKHKRPIHNFC